MGCFIITAVLTAVSRLTTTGRREGENRRRRRRRRRVGEEGEPALHLLAGRRRDADVLTLLQLLLALD